VLSMTLLLVVSHLFGVSVSWVGSQKSKERNLGVSTVGDGLPRSMEHNEHELDHLKVYNALGTKVGLHPALTAGLPWRRNSGANKHLTGNLV
jgi:hypothetical protein